MTKLFAQLGESDEELMTPQHVHTPSPLKPKAISLGYRPLADTSTISTIPNQSYSNGDYRRRSEINKIVYILTIMRFHMSECVMVVLFIVNQLKCAAIIRKHKTKWKHARSY